MGELTYEPIPIGRQHLGQTCQPSQYFYWDKLVSMVTGFMNLVIFGCETAYTKRTVAIVNDLINSATLFFWVAET